MAALGVLALVPAVAVGGPTIAASAAPGDSPTGPAASVDPPGNDVLETQATAPREELPASLEGAVTAPPRFVDGRVLVGTDRGLYVLSNGSVDAFVPTRPVRSIEHVDGPRAVVLVEDDHFPNVLGVDLEDGEVRWTESRQRRVYSSDLGHVDRQVPAFDAAAIGDVDGDGTADVAVAAGSAVFALDGASGERLWTVEHRRNVWQVASIDGRVFAGTGAGTLLAVDADDGERVYERTLAEPFDSEEVDAGPVPRSVWDVEPFTVVGVDRLAVTTEDGTVAVVDPEDGTVAWSETVFEFDDDVLSEYYDRGSQLGSPATVPGDANFFNLRVTPVEDEAALAVEVDVDDRPRLRGYEDGASELHLLEADSGSVRWSNDDLALQRSGPVAYGPELDGGSLLVARVPESVTQEVALLGVDDGAASTTELPAVPGAYRYGPDVGTGYVAVDGDRMAVTSTEGDLRVVDESGTVEWEFPSIRGARVERADYTGDGAGDALLTSRNAIRDGVPSRSLALRSGTDGSIRWSRSLSVADFHEEGGHTWVRTVEADGGRDVLAARNPPRGPGTDSQELPPSAIVVYSGETGERLGRHELTNEDGQFAEAGPDRKFRPVSVDVLGDVTGNGNANVVVGFRGRVAVLDVRSGDVVWERLYREPHPESDVEQWRPVAGDDVRYRTVGRGDDRRLVAISRNEGEIAVLEPATGADGFDGFRTVAEATYDGELVTRFDQRRLGDLTGDGYDELLIPIREDESATWKAFSPEADETIAEFGPVGRTAVVPTGADVTGDGRPATVVFERRGEDSRTTVYDGGDEVWSRGTETVYRLGDLVPGAPMPAAPAGDVDGDGTEEVAYVETSDRGSVRVRLYDAPTGEVVETVNLTGWEAPDSDLVPGIEARRIPDRTGDGEPELGVVALGAGGPRAGAEFFVVDPAEGEPLISGEGRLVDFVDLERGVGLVGADGAVRTVDVTQGVTLAEPQPEPDSESALRVEWRFDTPGDYHTTVTVNGRPVAATTDRSTRLRLPAGTHEIAVRSTGTNGVTVHDTVSVTVEEETSADLLLYGATGLSVAILFAIGLVPALVGRVRR